MHKKRLDSWKAIAEFLGRSLRTVQRWHDLNGLPVHHYGGHKGSVFAYEEEIDRWLAGLAEATGSAPIQGDEALLTCRRSSQELTSTADSMWETRSERNIQTIADLYRKAIDNDSQNAAALTGLANSMIFCAINDIVDGAIAFPSAVEALRRIPQVDAERLDAKCPAAWIDLLHRRNWRQARTGFEEVVRAQPSSFALSGLAALHIAEGRIEQALECTWEAWRINPLVRSLSALLCWIKYLSGDFRQVVDLIDQVRAGGGDGGLVTAVEALVLIQDGAIPTNLARLEKAASELTQNQTLQGCLGYAYGILGEEDKARRKFVHLAHCCEANRKSNGYALALVSLGLDEKEEAISWLEASYAEGALWSLGFRSDPALKPLQGNSRFERLLSKIGETGRYQPLVRFPGNASHPGLESALAVGGS